MYLKTVFKTVATQFYCQIQLWQPCKFLFILITTNASVQYNQNCVRLHPHTSINLALVVLWFSIIFFWNNAEPGNIMKTSLFVSWDLCDDQTEKWVFVIRCFSMFQQLLTNRHNSLNIKIAMAEHFYLLQRIIFFYLNKIFYQNPTSLDTLCIGEINWIWLCFLRGIFPIG